MSFIKEISKDKADGLLEEIYNEISGKRGKLSNIMKVQSLAPKAMRAHLDLYISLLFSKSKLKRDEREAIATRVSFLNECEYCINHHAEALNFHWKDMEKVKSFYKDPEKADIKERLKAFVRYADKVTKQPSKTDKSDIESLREHGLGDKDILILNMIISYFNFVNRIALGLGVEFSKEEIEGYNY